MLTDCLNSSWNNVSVLHGCQTGYDLRYVLEHKPLKQHGLQQHQEQWLSEQTESHLIRTKSMREQLGRPRQPAQLCTVQLCC